MIKKSESLISVCIITLGRETIYRTLETIFQQKIDERFEIVIVLQGRLDMDRINDLNNQNIPVNIYNYPHNLGFGYYRNRCIEKANGDILAWIDDDEWTVDDKWIENLTRPIREESYEVVTSGCLIPLGQGYMTDCISRLGYPGGGALGFEKVWKVGTDGLTKHLCSGNFAIKKTTINRIGFSEYATHGGEDNGLARSLFKQNISILYTKMGTVFHVSRNMHDFPNWFWNRKKSFQKSSSLDLYEESKHLKVLSFIKNFVTIDKYLFGKMYLLVFLLLKK